jgi:hypothetical protein
MGSSRPISTMKSSVMRGSSYRAAVISCLIICVFCIQYTMLRMLKSQQDHEALNLQLFTVSVSSDDLDLRSRQIQQQQQQEKQQRFGTLDNNKVDDRIPRRLITVFGLESSGTTFVFDSIREAMKLPFKVGDEAYNLKRSTMIQHVSLPTGSYLEPRNEVKWPEEEYQPVIVPFAVPMECRAFVGRPTMVMIPPHHKCGPYADSFVLDTERTHPSRYFVNITSHIQWYETQRTQVTAVLVVRDPSMHFHGVLNNHCRNNETAAYEQYQVGRSLMQDAIKAFDATRNAEHPSSSPSSSSIVIVSYETLMTLHNEYLFQIFQQIGIKFDRGYRPAYKDGNIKYVKSLPDTIGRHLDRHSSGEPPKTEEN